MEKNHLRKRSLLLDLDEITIKPKPKYCIGDLVVFNKTKDFGNEYDELFHIHSKRYGTCCGVLLKKWWYSGHLLEIRDSDSRSIQKIPVFYTTLTNADEECIRGLEHLTIPRE